VDFVVVIPARYASTRLPGKPLCDIGGKPLLQHVYERAREAAATEIVIATDDERVGAAAAAFGATVSMTAPDHVSGTDRIAEVVAARGYGDDTVIVNLQGDEPLMPAAVLRQVARNLSLNPAASMATLCEAIADPEQLRQTSAVKVVTDRHGFALYFSRATIPWDRDHFAKGVVSLSPLIGHFRHIGMYAYRAGFLRELTRLEPCPLEITESLEQLRALWYGYRIHVAQAVEPTEAGVDTPEDLARVRAVFAKRL
jgi:3-deoxy-manno-octulosonate cytidylyltransferase (CMP-KDO synthetase)